MVNLVDFKLCVRIPETEGVETGSQKDILANTAFHRACEMILREAAAGYQPRSHHPGRVLIQVFFGVSQDLRVPASQQRHSNGVIQHQRARVIDLMSRASQSHTECGTRRVAFVQTTLVATLPSW